ncbi:MAG: histidine kinase dimerization/phospho-acceptor domain-containing protein [Syntrophomonas sp.]
MHLIKFIRGIGHEIRNPMTSVHGFLQMLAGLIEYIFDIEYFSTMIEELDRANPIITNFFSSSKSGIPFDQNLIE